MTAAVYMRGLMQHEFGVKPSDVEWVQGRHDRLGRKLPADIKLTQAPAGTELGDMLERGEIDFMMTANNPLSFRRGAKTVARLFPNYAEMEKDYYKRTKIYPIMHTVVIKREIYDRDPWVALNLYNALCRAKDYCYHHLTETGSPKASFAWLQPMIEEEKKIIGEDWYPYGIEQNRPTIEALLQYTHEHGLTDRRVKLEELFAPATMRDIPLSEGQLRLERSLVPTISGAAPSHGAPSSVSSTVSTRNWPFDRRVFSGRARRGDGRQRIAAGAAFGDPACQRRAGKLLHLRRELRRDRLAGFERTRDAVEPGIGLGSAASFANVRVRRTQQPL